MTDEQAKALGLRALAAGFKWAAGVKLGTADETYRLTFAWYGEDDGEGATPVLHPAGDGIGPGWGWPAKGSSWWPDFRDPATLGVLVAQVRERRGQPMHSAPALTVPRRAVCEWRVWSASGVNRYWAGATEPEAWVAALEACPET